MSGRRRLAVSAQTMLVILGVLAFLLLVVAANIQLLRAAFESQPDCVAVSHEDDGGQGQYRAAKRSC